MSGCIFLQLFGRNLYPSQGCEAPAWGVRGRRWSANDRPQQQQQQQQHQASDLAKLLVITQGTSSSRIRNGLQAWMAALVVNQLDVSCQRKQTTKLLHTYGGPCSVVPYSRAAVLRSVQERPQLSSSSNLFCCVSCVCFRFSTFFIIKSYISMEI